MSTHHVTWDIESHNDERKEHLKMIQNLDTKEAINEYIYFDNTFVSAMVKRHKSKPSMGIRLQMWYRKYPPG